VIFLANRANLDRRTLLTRLHDRLQTQVSPENSPVERVQYHTAAGNKVGVQATIDAPAFLGTPYAVDEAELQVSFDFPTTHEYDFYAIQWVEPERDLMVGWHQDETHADIGECHFQIDYRDETVQRASAAFLDTHPLNVFDERTDQLVAILEQLTWEDGLPTVPKDAVR
jgi:hypothetical protein